MWARLKELWAELTAPYDDELEEAKAVVCEHCQYDVTYCSECPVPSIRKEIER